MEGQIQSLERRLAEVTSRFFESKIGVKPQEVQVLEQGDLIVLRVRGFLAKAEAAIVQRPEDRQILTNYYTRLFESFYPMVEVVVEQACKRSIIDRQAILDLPNSECVYLLTLGGSAPERG